MDIVSARRQDQQWNTLTQCEAIFTGQLSKNYNNLQQNSIIQMNQNNLQAQQKNIPQYLNIHKQQNTIRF